MTALDAIHKVLEDAHQPLHYREITRRILERQLWKTEGKTPEATVNAQLGTDIKMMGATSRFQRTDKGTYALCTWRLPEYRVSQNQRQKEPLHAVAVTIDREQEPAKDQGAIKKQSKSAQGMSFTDAAEHVLEKFGGRAPMHYREITKKAMSLGLLQTKGQTPDATLYAQILTENERKTKRGDTPRFVKHGKGYVGLRQWMGQGLAFQIKQHNEEVRAKLLKQLEKMDSGEFEDLIGRLLVAIGFASVEVTRRSGDGGIDVRGTLIVGDVIRTRMAVQAKRWNRKKNVQAPVVQQVRGSLGAHEQGLVITTSDFSPGARDEAARHDATPVGLMNGEQLVSLLAEHGIGIERTNLDIFELGVLMPE